MKKQSLKNLKLNKKPISSLQFTTIKGGKASNPIYAACADDWKPTIMNTFDCPATQTRCGGADCVEPRN